MKVILSRKGFDETTGGAASPIYKNKLISFPIPEEGTGTFYKDLRFDKDDRYIKVMKDLGIKMFSETHLDPDLRKSILRNRHKEWRPIFGQSEIAQSILRKAGVEEGDLFLFFGWFKELIKEDDKFRYKNKNDKGAHLVFGYMEVGEIISISEDNVPEYAKNHVHIKNKDDYGNNNTIYIAKKKSTIDKTKPGAGCFNYDKSLILTKENSNKSVWELPIVFKNCLGEFNGHFMINEEHTDAIVIQPKGMVNQELMISSNEDIVKWAKNLIKSNRVYTKL